MLRVTLHINDKQIGDYEIRNVTPTEKLTLYGRCKYEVRPIDDAYTPDMEPMLYLTHRRVDGAEELAAKALMKLARLDY